MDKARLLALREAAKTRGDVNLVREINRTLFLAGWSDEPETVVVEAPERRPRGRPRKVR